MRPIAVLFATREGHTRKIAAHVAASLRARGHEVELFDIADLLDESILDRCSSAVLAASVHIGRHEKEMISFARKHRDRLERIPSAFLSVSLSEAGVEREGASSEKREEARKAVAQMIDQFWEETGWRADLVKPVAGALVYTKYGTVIRFVMKQIAKKAGGDTDTSRDYEYTDWSGLDRFLDTFTSLLPTGAIVKAATVSVASFIPRPRLVQVHHVDVDAPASLAYELAHHFDLGRSRLIRLLMRLRTGGESGSLRLDEIGREGGGFQLLSEEPGSSFVVGAIGRFWEKEITFAKVAPDRFATFDEAGWCKVAWSIRVEPIARDKSRIFVEVRVTATDDESWKRFQPYWKLIGRFSKMIRRRALRMMAHDLAPKQTIGDVGEGILGGFEMLLAFVTPMLRRKRSRWGLDAATAKRVFPGDEWIEHPRWQWTHGIEIDAPPERVWPWVAQIGCEIQNAERIHSEWSDPKLGDALRLHPRMRPIPIVAVEPGGWFLAQAAGDDDVAVSWLFFLEPIDGGKKTRFISRYRIDYPTPWSLRLGPALVEPVGFVMDRRMLVGVKERAERG
jgi:menaquinone-dependent protoporphyrinogen IX oxidase